MFSDPSAFSPLCPVQMRRGRRPAQRQPQKGNAGWARWEEQPSLLHEASARLSQRADHVQTLLQLPSWEQSTVRLYIFSAKRKGGPE